MLPFHSSCVVMLCFRQGISEATRGAAQITSTLAAGFTLVPSDAMFSVMHTDPHCKGIAQQSWVMIWWMSVDAKGKCWR